MSVAIEVQDNVSASIQRLVAGLSDRTRLHEFIARRAGHLTSDYLRKIAGERHKTANQLGAQPTGHLSRAAESVSARGTNDAAIVGVTSPGIGRAFRDIEIQPLHSKYLTIAANAASYGKRARTFQDLFFVRMKRAGRVILALARKSQDSEMFVMYWLVKKVRQKQDRALLPSDEAYSAAAMQGVRDYIRAIQEVAA